MVLDAKSSQEYPTNAVLPQGSILGPTPFLLYVNDLPDDVICDIAIWFLNLNLIYETLWTGAGSGLLISMLERLNWFHLTSLIKLVLLM